jgi:hypothetical protein
VQLLLRGVQSAGLDGEGPVQVRLVGRPSSEAR